MISRILLISLSVGLGSLFAFALLVVSINVVKIKRAIRQFNSKSNGLPLLEKPSLLSGHLYKFATVKHLCEEITNLHLRCGKTFAWLCGEKVFVFTLDLDLIKKIVFTEPNKHINRSRIELPLREFEQSNIIAARDEQWRRIRRAFGPALRSQKFKAPNVVEEIESSIEKLVSGIEARLEGKQVVEMDIEDLLHRYSLDMVYSCFYKQYNLIDFEAEKDKRVEMIDEGLFTVRKNPILVLGLVFPILKPLVYWLQMNFHPQGKWRNELMGFIEAQTRLSYEARKRLEQLRAARKEEVNCDEFQLENGAKFKRNLMDHITDSFLDGKLGKEEYFNSAYFLILAADKTASDALSRTIYYLAVGERVQELTRASVLADGTDSEYLSWAINETLRLCPPVPMGCPRVAAEDIEVPDGSGHVVPRGASVVTPLYSIHRLPEYWGDDAAEFKPERWANAKSFHPCQFMPFGAGIRGCPGKELALFEMKKLLCTLLTRYRFEAEEKPVKFDAPFLIFLINDEPIRVRVSRLKPQVEP